MKEKVNVVPVPTAVSKPFWEGTKIHKLLVPKCRNCGKKHFYPRRWCPECAGEEFDWVELSGKGKIYSFTEVKAGAAPEFEQALPYVVALVELEDGIRMLTNIVECDPEKLECDAEVEVVFEKLTDEITLPKFRPVAS